MTFSFIGELYCDTCKLVLFAAVSTVMPYWFQRITLSCLQRCLEIGSHYVDTMNTDFFRQPIVSLFSIILLLSVCVQLFEYQITWLKSCKTFIKGLTDDNRLFFPQTGRRSCCQGKTYSCRGDPCIIFMKGLSTPKLSTLDSSGSPSM